MSQNEAHRVYETLIAECDQLIKAGKIGVVATRLSQLNLTSVPRASRQGLAKICRRSGQLKLGLRLLQPLIRNKKLETVVPTVGEICEYAILLSHHGSVQEALVLLQGIEVGVLPEAILYTGYCYILTWEYEKAASCFQQFLELSADDYMKLIARVNLVSCYIVTSRLKEASELLTEILSEVQKAGANRLQGNCFELWGQIHFWQNDFQAARKSLNKAREMLGQSQSHDQLLISKSEAIMSALEQKSIDPLMKFKQEALARKYWESVREADLFILKVKFDQKQLDHLIFGTPMQPYRQRIQQLIGATPSTNYTFGSDQKLCLNLETGKMNGPNNLPAGGKIHQVVAALVRDFYVPINMGTLFSELYPGEFFDIDSSPFRVRQLILRTRDWFKENEIPVVIEQNKGTYRLSITGDFGIQKTLENLSVDIFLAKWTELKNIFPPDVVFTTQEVCEKMGWSRSTFHRLMEWALKKNEIQRTGSGKFIQYRISTESQNRISAKVA